MNDSEFEVLLNDVQIPVKRLIYYKVNDTHIADDIYQDTIVSAWRKTDCLGDNK